jgi:hypothetical protein
MSDTQGNKNQDNTRLLGGLTAAFVFNVVGMIALAFAPGWWWLLLLLDVVIMLVLIQLNAGQRAFGRAIWVLAVLALLLVILGICIVISAIFPSGKIGG